MQLHNLTVVVGLSILDVISILFEVLVLAGLVVAIVALVRSYRSSAPPRRLIVAGMVVVGGLLAIDAVRLVFLVLLWAGFRNFTPS